MPALSEIVSDFAAALKAVDSSRPRYKTWPEGIGAFPETQLVSRGLNYLQENYKGYEKALLEQPVPNLGNSRCDLVIPGEWVIEFKQTGVYMSEGFESEYWTKSLIHPFLGLHDGVAKSLAGDAVKLMCSGFNEKKAIVLMHFEHTPAELDVELPIGIFEHTARNMLGIPLGERVHSTATALVHPHHVHLKVFGWLVGGIKERHAVSNPEWLTREIKHLERLADIDERRRKGVDLVGEMTVAELNDEMRRVYDMDIRCYRGRKPVGDNEKIGEIVGKGFSPGSLQISSRYKIGTIETRFKKEFGLTVQIVDRQGKLINDKTSLARSWRKRT